LIKNNKSFHSKILLAGEYTVIEDGYALALPFRKYTGRFEISTNKLQLELHNLYIYLIENNLDIYFDLDQMLVDIKSGLSYKSDIPVGYGLGSSGALIAALYDRYGYKDLNDYNALKSILGRAECAFHGTSSGMDPFVSYLDQPVLFTKDGIQLIIDSSFNLSDFFLIDTGISRSTAHYVQLFKAKCERSKIYRDQVKELQSLNADLIKAILNNQQNDVKSSLKSVSTLQFEMFQEMIPDDYKEVWQQGLQSEEYYLKLCGAGGGGMILGWSDTPSFDCKYTLIQI
jgi:mevalonate kinase